MRSMNLIVVKQAQEFAARWGFLTRDLFYDFICCMSPVQNYRYWNLLTDSGSFIVSSANSSVLLLSHKSRRTLFGNSARPSRLPTYIEHDSAAARILLTLEKYGLIAHYWLEDELMRDPISSYSILGADKTHRIPDVVFDLKNQNGFVRCILEIERTVKPQSRYDRIAMSYFNYSKVDLVLFGCNGLAAEKAVKRAFEGRDGKPKRLVPGLYQLEEFKLVGLESKIRFQDRERSMKNFVEVVSGDVLFAPVSKRNLNEKRISFRNTKNEEAA